MPQVVDFFDAPKAIEKWLVEGTKELYTAGKIEGGVAVAGELIEDQRRDTLRLVASTTVTGRRPIPHDPGAGLHAPPSNTEMVQAAESTIPRDDPTDLAHVIEAAGIIEGRAYGSFVERHYKTGENAVRAVDSSGAAARAADRRAVKAMKRRGLG